MNWKLCLRDGAEAAQSCLWMIAEQQYIEAMTELELALSREPANTEMTTGWIAVHHGLSALYQAQGDERRAFRHLMVPHQSVINQLSRAECDCTRAQFRKAINQTLPPLLLGAKNQRLCEDCRKMLERSRELLTEAQYLH